MSRKDTIREIAVAIKDAMNDEELSMDSSSTEIETVVARAMETPAQKERAAARAEKEEEKAKMKIAKAAEKIKVKEEKEAARKAAQIEKKKAKVQARIDRETAKLAEIESD
jgi:hypothetical protein